MKICGCRAPSVLQRLLLELHTSDITEKGLWENYCLLKGGPHAASY